MHVACCIGNVVASFVKSFDRSQGASQLPGFRIVQRSCTAAHSTHARTPHRCQCRRRRRGIRLAHRRRALLARGEHTEQRPASSTDSLAGNGVQLSSLDDVALVPLRPCVHSDAFGELFEARLPAPPLTPLLQFMNPFRTGKLVLFQVSYDRDWHYFEMFFYSIIGVFGVRRLLPGVPPLC